MRSFDLNLNALNLIFGSNLHSRIHHWWKTPFCQHENKRWSWPRIINEWYQFQHSSQILWKNVFKNPADDDTEGLVSFFGTLEDAILPLQLPCYYHELKSIVILDKKMSMQQNSTLFKQRTIWLWLHQTLLPWPIQVGILVLEMINTFFMQWTRMRMLMNVFLHYLSNVLSLYCQEYALFWYSYIYWSPNQQDAIGGIAAF